MKFKEYLQEQSKESQNIRQSIFKFFEETPPKSDDDVHAFAKKLNIAPDILEQNIYDILSSFLSVGKSKDYRGTYDADQIKKGIKVEMEHTNCPLIAERIAKDHLSEFGGKYYYDYLDKMEKELEKKVGG